GISAEKVQGGLVIALHDTAPIPVTRGGIVRNRRTNTYDQKITITNNTAVALPGPFYVALDAISLNTTLANASGTTSVYAPLNSPYINVLAGSLAPGASASVTLQFTKTANNATNYTARVLNSVVTP
ncbi:MAG: hypothetical protein H7Y43_14920, partial [Akkermansiaceae bacterium]|nr:hypothetical protein [Verrucomicrobiales bacterium]